MSITDTLRTRKKMVAAVGLLVLLIVIVWTVVARGNNKQPQYQTAQVERGLIISSISASGQIATSDMPITTQATGIVKAIYVKDGDTVKAGDKILKIQLDQDGRQTKAKAWSSYLAAKNAVDVAVQNQMAARKDAGSAGTDVSNADQSKLASLQNIQQAQSALTAAQSAWDKAQDSSASEADKQQKLYSLEAAQTALALAQQKYNDSGSSNSTANNENKIALQRDLQQAQSALAGAQDAYDLAAESTSTSSSGLNQKFYALQAAQTALALAQQKYDDADSSNSTNQQQSNLSLQKDLQQAQSALVAAQNAWNEAQDPSVSDADKQQKLYSLEAAQTALTLAQEKYASADDAIAQASLSAPLARQRIKSSNSALLKAQADLSSAYESYQATLGTVVAPADGKISDLLVTVGTAVSGSSSGSSSGGSSSSSSSSSQDGQGQSSGGSSGSSGSQTVARLSISNEPMVTVNLSEIDISKVKIGQKATLTLDAFSGKTFTGKVTGIDKTGTVSSGVTNYPVSIIFDTLDDNILPNMAVNANIITETKDNVLLIPLGAAQTSQSGQSTVSILKNGQSQAVPVETGLSSDTQMEVVSGLSEGQTIVTGVVNPTAQASSGSASPFSGGSPFGGGARAGGGGGGTMIMRGGGGFGGGR